MRVSDELAALKFLVDRLENPTAEEIVEKPRVLVLPAKHPSHSDCSSGKGG